MFDGSLVRLEPLVPEHHEVLVEISQDPRIWTWLGILESGNFAPDRSAFDAWFQHALDESAAHNEVVFAIVDKRLERVVGSTRYGNLRARHKSLSILWTWLSPSVWGAGINVESKLLMLEHAFERIGCRRVEFLADSRNEHGRGVLAAMPAHLDGVLRAHLQLAEGERDTACYSIISDEWPQVRANLERRLGSAVSRSGGPSGP